MKTEDIVTLLNDLGQTIQETVIAARSTDSSEALSAVAEESDADTIFQIDKITEEAILEWFENQWPRDFPVAIVMEGLPENKLTTFPPRRKPDALCGTVIIDPIDGTRNIMYDKRSAWALAAFSPLAPPKADLQSIEVASMTELPTTKQWRADQLSAVRGCGPQGVSAFAYDLIRGTKSSFQPRPSEANDLTHGYASLVRFFPEGKSLTAKIEEDLLSALIGPPPSKSPLVFEDQYTTTAGQMYEILIGHDRFIGDIRPLVFNHLGYQISLASHPYDICTSLIASELGCIICHPDGSPLNAPLNLTYPVAWCGFANQRLADLILEKLKNSIAKYLK